jgi:hypothetical protein
MSELQPEVFYMELTPYPLQCPQCSLGWWMSISTVIRVQGDLWSARSQCYLCKCHYGWSFNPDIPLAGQDRPLIKILA